MSRIKFAIALLQCLLISSAIFAQKVINQKVINLKFDNERITLTNSKDRAYKKGARYKFQVNDVNSAYHKVDFSMQETKRDIAIPDVLKAIVPLTPQPLIPTTHALVNDGGISADTLSKKFRADYEMIRQYLKVVKTEIKRFDTAYKDTAQCHLIADNAINEGAKRIGLPNDTRDAGQLKDTLSGILDELSNIFQLLKESGIIHYNGETAIPLEYYYAIDFINKNKASIILTVTILEDYQKCKSYVESTVYTPGKSDFLTTTIRVTWNKYSPGDSIKTNLSFYRVNYWSISVSGGFFWNTLLNPAYYYSDAAGHYNKEQESNSDISVGALLHVSYVLMPEFKLGPCIGAGISILDGKTKFLGGLSARIGKKNEFVISGGVALANLNAPSNGISVTSSITPGATVTTYSKFTQGWFAGIGYSLIKN